VENPRSDFSVIYNADYYDGRGADPLVDYICEVDHPLTTIRRYEWRGIVRAVVTLTGTQQIKWLDYGCGVGGLVHYAQDEGVKEVIGYDEGWPAAWMLAHGRSLATRHDLDCHHKSTFDVVTAIEVLEHVSDPVAVLTHISSLLKPGGLFFMTTGNAQPHRNRLAKWNYVNPDIHVSYFEPTTLAEAYRRAGLVPFFPGFLPGYDDIIRYKILKNLRVESRNRFEALLPWRAITRVVDYRHRITAHPLAYGAGA
jgi:SAM-dependent methyltransferase